MFPLPVPNECPDWAPGKVCTLCRMKFSLTKRASHCRNCGFIFCRVHCSQTALLPHLGLEGHHKVCDDCMDRINEVEASMRHRRTRKPQFGFAFGNSNGINRLNVFSPNTAPTSFTLPSQKQDTQIPLGSEKAFSSLPLLRPLSHHSTPNTSQHDPANGPGSAATTIAATPSSLPQSSMLPHSSDPSLPHSSLPDAKTPPLTHSVLLAAVSAHTEASQQTDMSSASPTSIPVPCSLPSASAHPAPHATHPAYAPLPSSSPASFTIRSSLAAPNGLFSIPTASPSPSPPSHTHSRAPSSLSSSLPTSIPSSPPPSPPSTQPSFASTRTPAASFDALVPAAPSPPSPHAQARAQPTSLPRTLESGSGQLSLDIHAHAHASPSHNHVSATHGHVPVPQGHVRTRAARFLSTASPPRSRPHASPASSLPSSSPLSSSLPASHPRALTFAEPRTSPLSILSALHTPGPLPHTHAPSSLAVQLQGLRAAREAGVSNSDHAHTFSAAPNTHTQTCEDNRVCSVATLPGPPLVAEPLPDTLPDPSPSPCSPSGLPRPHPLEPCPSPQSSTDATPFRSRVSMLAAKFGGGIRRVPDAPPTPSSAGVPATSSAPVSVSTAVGASAGGDDEAAGRAARVKSVVVEGEVLEGSPAPTLTAHLHTHPDTHTLELPHDNTTETITETITGATTGASADAHTGSGIGASLAVCTNAVVVGLALSTTDALDGNRPLLAPPASADCFENVQRRRSSAVCISAHALPPASAARRPSSIQEGDGEAEKEEERRRAGNKQSEGEDVLETHLLPAVPAPTVVMPASNTNTNTATAATAPSSLAAPPPVLFSTPSSETGARGSIFHRLSRAASSKLDRLRSRVLAGASQDPDPASIAAAPTADSTPTSPVSLAHARSSVVACEPVTPPHAAPDRSAPSQATMGVRGSLFPSSVLFPAPREADPQQAFTTPPAHATLLTALWSQEASSAWAASVPALAAAAVTPAKLDPRHPPAALNPSKDAAQVLPLSGKPSLGYFLRLLLTPFSLDPVHVEFYAMVLTMHPLFLTSRSLAMFLAAALTLSPDNLPNHRRFLSLQATVLSLLLLWLKLCPEDTRTLAPALTHVLSPLVTTALRGHYKRVVARLPSLHGETLHCLRLLQRLREAWAAAAHVHAAHDMDAQLISRLWAARLASVLPSTTEADTDTNAAVGGEAAPTTTVSAAVDRCRRETDISASVPPLTALTSSPAATPAPPLLAAGSLPPALLAHTLTLAHGRLFAAVRLREGCAQSWAKHGGWVSRRAAELWPAVCQLVDTGCFPSDNTLSADSAASNTNTGAGTGTGTATGAMEDVAGMFGRYAEFDPTHSLRNNLPLPPPPDTTGVARLARSLGLSAPPMGLEWWSHGLSALAGAFNGTARWASMVALLGDGTRVEGDNTRAESSRGRSESEGARMESDPVGAAGKDRAQSLVAMARTGAASDAPAETGVGTDAVADGMVVEVHDTEAGATDGVCGELPPSTGANTCLPETSDAGQPHASTSISTVSRVSVAAGAASTPAFAARQSCALVATAVPTASSHTAAADAHGIEATAHAYDGGTSAEAALEDSTMADDGEDVGVGKDADAGSCADVLMPLSPATAVRSPPPPPRAHAARHTIIATTAAPEHSLAHALSSPAPGGLLSLEDVPARSSDSDVPVAFDAAPSASMLARASQTSPFAALDTLHLTTAPSTAHLRASIASSSLLSSPFAHHALDAKVSLSLADIAAEPAPSPEGSPVLPAIDPLADPRARVVSASRVADRDSRGGNTVQFLGVVVRPRPLTVVGPPAPEHIPVLGAAASTSAGTDALPSLVLDSTYTAATSTAGAVTAASPADARAGAPGPVLPLATESAPAGAGTNAGTGPFSLSTPSSPSWPAPPTPFTHAHVRTLATLIITARALLAAHNYFSLSALATGLAHSSVARLPLWQHTLDRTVGEVRAMGIDTRIMHFGSRGARVVTLSDDETLGDLWERVATTVSNESNWATYRQRWARACHVYLHSLAEPRQRRACGCAMTEAESTAFSASIKSAAKSAVVREDVDGLEEMWGGRAAAPLKGVAVIGHARCECLQPPAQNSVGALPKGPTNALIDDTEGSEDDALPTWLRARTVLPLPLLPCVLRDLFNCSETSKGAAVDLIAALRQQYCAEQGLRDPEQVAEERAQQARAEQARARAEAKARKASAAAAAAAAAEAAVTSADAHTDAALCRVASAATTGSVPGITGSTGSGVVGTPDCEAIALVKDVVVTSAAPVAGDATAPAAANTAVASAIAETVAEGVSEHGTRGAAEEAGDGAGEEVLDADGSAEAFSEDLAFWDLDVLSARTRRHAVFVPHATGDTTASRGAVAEHVAVGVVCGSADSSGSLRESIGAASSAAPPSPAPMRRALTTLDDTRATRVAHTPPTTPFLTSAAMTATPSVLRPSPATHRPVAAALTTPVRWTAYTRLWRCLQPIAVALHAVQIHALAPVASATLPSLTPFVHSCPPVPSADSAQHVVSAICRCRGALPACLEKTELSPPPIATSHALARAHNAPSTAGSSFNPPAPLCLLSNTVTGPGDAGNTILLFRCTCGETAPGVCFDAEPDTDEREEDAERASALLSPPPAPTADCLARLPSVHARALAECSALPRTLAYAPPAQPQWLQTWSSLPLPPFAPACPTSVWHAPAGRALRRVLIDAPTSPMDHATTPTPSCTPSTRKAGVSSALCRECSALLPVAAAMPTMPALRAQQLLCPACTELALAQDPRAAVSLMVNMLMQAVDGACSEDDLWTLSESLHLQ